MKRALIATASAAATLGVACAVVLAAFTAGGSGAPTVQATTMPTATTAPTVSVSGRDVSVSWTQRTMGNGTAVAGYTLARYSAAGGSAVSVLSSCSGTVAALTCTENSVTPGSWRYTVTPVQGNAWHGTESARSAGAVVSSPSVSLSASAVAPSHSLTASISGFDDGDAVSFHLGSASGTVIGSAVASSAAGSNGTGSGTVTIPAGTTSGTYSVYAVGTDTASTTVVVDGTAPVVSASTVAGNATTPGYVAQGAQYFVYANASDSGGSNLASVTADVHNVTSGATSVTLTAGTYTVGATSYGFRSAALTAGNPLAAGAKSYSVTAVDGVGNSSGAVSGSVTVDNTAPTVSATVIAPTSGGTAGTISAGSTYYVYANASDAASGVASVTADVHNVTTGATSVALVAGSYTANSISYGYRSASQTADSALTPGSKAYTVSATDNVGNASGAVGGTVTVSATPPTISAVALAHTPNTTQQGSLANGVSYYVYANVSAGSLSISTVTANLTSISGAGKSSVALVAGSYSAFGSTYNYRSAAVTANSGLSGTLSYTVNATDTSSNSATPVNGSVTVDNTAPTVSAISSSNNNGTVDVGDTFAVTFNKQIDPGTVDQTTGGATLTFSQSGNNDVMVAITGLMAASDTGIAKAPSQGTPSWVVNAKSISYPGTLSISPNNKTVTFTVTGACIGNNCTNNAAAGTAGQLQYVPDTSTSSPFKLNDYAGNVPGSTATNYPTTGTIKVF
jgi:hypothetical protein